MTRRLLPLLGLAALLGAGAAPAAQSQALPLPTTTVPAPKPAGGKMWLGSRSGIATRKFRYVSRGQTIKVYGHVRPYVPGQVVTVQARQGGKVRAAQRVQVRPGRKGRGRFVVRFKALRGKTAIVAAHAATPQQVALRAKLKTVKAVGLQAGQGSRGTKVVLLQRGLRGLGYVTPVSGSFDSGTSRAVLAFRKANGMGRGGFAGSATFRKVLRGRGRFKLKYPKAGRHVEFDWSRQLVVLADKGKARHTLHASSGKASTPTVFGTFRFYLKTPGTNSHGMVHSNYFIGGYAIHGYASVPNYPASHGCIRIPIPNALFVYRWVKLRTRIFVYR
jgi:hypothetical protein